MEGLRVKSGGQTGVDRAALDAAIALGVPCGGWCPRGRKAEDGVIPNRYPLAEMETASYPARTHRNVAESDGTLLLLFVPLSGGSLLTWNVCGQLGKPRLAVLPYKGGWWVAGEPRDQSGLQGVLDWRRVNDIHVLNVAGTRESKYPGAYILARSFLEQLFRSWMDS